MSSSSRYSGHGHFLGNGGQAIEVDGRLFTRDLFEYDVYRTPYCKAFSHERSTTLYARLHERALQLSFPKNLEFPLETLTDKLYSLEELFPNLGSVLLEAMHCYTWEPVPFALPLTHETAGNIPEQEWVQVANRLRQKIYISEAPWHRLSNLSRTALLIHESTYSLLKPERLAPHCYRQFGNWARRLTAAFFTEKTFTDPSAKSQLLLDLNRLNISRGSFNIEQGSPEFFPYLTASGFEQLALRV